MNLETKNLTYEYDAGTTQAVRAVDDISISIPTGQFVGIVGHTGSGKTTFVQLLDGLLKPSSGSVYLDGEDINGKKYDRKSMRAAMGIVFQYPEYQLFETTVLKDVCFGPLNMGLSREEAEKYAKEALARLGMKEDSYEASPFELSGGQKRRVAIAGVLAMNPKILILDEPTAGLDPEGREEVLGLLKSLNESGMTIILVSHSMEDVARYVDRIIVINGGKVFLDGNGKEVFAHVKELEEIGLAAPEVAYLMQAVNDAGIPVATNITTVEEAAAEILAKFQ
jgi:energy-coupling factor transport system ATP-binding protein